MRFQQTQLQKATEFDPNQHFLVKYQEVVDQQNSSILNAQIIIPLAERVLIALQVNEH